MIDFKSQVGQDKWVVDFFAAKEGGYFLDIGAHNGVDLSNSYYLEKKLGWNGICVEADPDLFEVLKNNRECICVNVAASDSSGKIKFLKDGFSGRAEENPRSIEIESKSLAEILEENNSPKVIDYLSLDIEGMELQVLSKFPFDEYEIILITVEHNVYMRNQIVQKNKQGIYDILTSNGYEIHSENVQSQGLAFEDWYINKKYLPNKF
jgi:FkbM family methyltransferase